MITVGSRHILTPAVREWCSYLDTQQLAEDSLQLDRVATLCRLISVERQEVGARVEVVGESRLQLVDVTRVSPYLKGVFRQVSVGRNQLSPKRTNEGPLFPRISGQHFRSPDRISGQYRIESTSKKKQIRFLKEQDVQMIGSPSRQGGYPPIYDLQ